VRPRGVSPGRGRINGIKAVFLKGEVDINAGEGNGNGTGGAYKEKNLFRRNASA